MAFFVAAGSSVLAGLAGASQTVASYTSEQLPLLDTRGLRINNSGGALVLSVALPLLLVYSSMF